MSDELKTIKFQMMLSPSEAEAIDEWGFRHRIRSRAEAIRRLCQMGLILNRKLPKTFSKLLKLSQSIPPSPKIDDSLGLAEKIEGARFLRDYYDQQHKQTLFTLEAISEISAILAEQTILMGKEVEASIAMASELGKKFDELGIQSKDGKDLLVEVLTAIADEQAKSKEGDKK